MKKKSDHSERTLYGILSKQTFRIMKLTTLFTLMTVFQLYASHSYSQMTKITLNVKNDKIVDVLTKIEDNSEFFFLYSPKLIDVEKRVDIKAKNKPIRDILNVIFDKDVNFEVYNRQIILTKKEIPAIITSPQQKKVVTGTVTDEKGLTMPGVSVQVEGTSIGTVTDVSGKYSIELPGENGVLVFTFIGFAKQRVVVKAGTIVDVTLIMEAQNLNEVVVVGYGTQKKVNLTGAVENVSTKDLTSRPVTTTSAAIQGKVTGVYVMQNSGQPGKDYGNILIRGVGTFNNNNPLVLIDGISGSMNDVNPMDVENISVLKDAAASAIYGNRAANGVILITTKRGQKDKMQVEYTTYMGRQTPTYLPEVLSSYEHATLYNEAALNSGKQKKYTDADISKYKDGTDPFFPNTSWQDLWYNPANMQNHHIQVSGGAKDIAYSFAGGYLDQDGVLLGTDYKKYNFRSNIDSYFLKNKNLHIGVNMAGVRSTLNESPYGTTGVIRSINRMIPNDIAVYPDGKFGVDRNYALYKSGGVNSNLSNKVTGKLLAELEIIKNLKAEVSYGIDWSHALTTNFYPEVNYYGSVLKYNNNQPTNSPSEITKGNSESLSTTLNAILRYSLALDGTTHSMDFLAGYSEEAWKTDYSSGYRKYLLSALPELNIGDVSTQTNSGGSAHTALRSYFGRVNYSYKSKYLLEGNVRYDGSSRFAKDLRYGLFPSASVGWRVSEESFFEPIKQVVNNMKVRVSWGQLGNQNINTYYAASDILETGSDYTFGGIFVPGVAVTTLTNKSTSWETTTQTNIGIDADLFKCITFTANYFNRETVDILMRTPIPITLGNLNTPYQNVGKMKNNGWELGLGYSKMLPNELKIGANLNLSHFNNKVLDLKGLGPIYGDYTILREGDPYYSFYGYEVEGIFQSDAEIAAAPKQSELPKPGDIRFKDQNGDGQITLDKDRVIIGKQVPDLLYSFMINLSWKGFDFSSFLQGVYGVSAYSSLELTSPFFNGASGGKWLLDRWTPENPSTTKQRVYLDSKRQGIASDYYLEDASYLRMKNIEVGYSLPKSLLSKAGIAGLRVYLNMQNAFTITKYKGFDPEKSAGNTRTDAHPQVRVSSAGLTLTF